MTYVLIVWLAMGTTQVEQAPSQDACFKRLEELRLLLPGGGSVAPFSTTAIGEMSNVAVPAAITNAVFDAVGVRLVELPISAEKVLEGLSEKASAT